MLQTFLLLSLFKQLPTSFMRSAHISLNGDFPHVLSSSNSYFIFLLALKIFLSPSFFFLVNILLQIQEIR